MYYREVQRFNQWYFLIFHLLLWGSSLAILYTEYFSTSSTKPADFESLFFIGLFLMISLFLMVINLAVTVGERGLSIRFFPFATEFHSWDKIQKAQVVMLKTITKGIRWSDDYGLIFNVKGNKGVFITCYNGEKYFIGSSNPEKLAVEIQERLK